MRIGEFAAAAGVTIKALRFYDEIGLLRPAARDALTGYRRYHPRQLADLAAIVSLREVGASLRQIKEALGGGPRGRRRLLERGRVELQRRVAEQARALAWIDTELARLDRSAPSAAIVLGARPGLRVASLRARLGAAGDVAELEAELEARVPEHLRLRRRGTLWHGCEGDPVPLEAEHFVELAGPFSGDSRITIRTLAPVVAACAFSVDDEAAAHCAFAEMRRFLAASGHRLVATKRELYWPGLLEIQFPIALPETVTGS